MMTNEEFEQLNRLLKIYAESELDQWDNFSFVTADGVKVYVSMGLVPPVEVSEMADVDLVYPEIQITGV